MMMFSNSLSIIILLMLKTSGSIFTKKGAIAVPTNGYIGKNGDGIMGAGLALEVAKRHHSAKKELGKHLKNNGNIVGWLIPRDIIIFPVKPVSRTLENSDKSFIIPRVRNIYKNGQTVPGFHCMADIDLIRKSFIDLVAFIEKEKLEKVYVPRVGCGHGGLSFWNDLVPLLRTLELPDNIVLVV